MPAFTAVGLIVAGAVTGATFASVGAALAAGAFTFAAVATITTIGAAYVTSRLINGNQNKPVNSATISEGGRIQLPPATNQKIPVIYGEAFVNGIITDARITDENKTMYYCLVLGERTQTGTYTIEDVYVNDLRAVFETGSGARHRVNQGVKKVNGPGEDFDTSFVVDSTNLIEVRVYAGGTGSANQIFPTTDTPVNAYDYWDNDSNTWDSTYEMAGLVFAIVKVRYNADKGLTGIPNFTFKLKNTLTNPAAVFRDYMTSVRYGAGIDGTYIPTGAGTAYNQWLDFCDEQIRYTDKDAASATQARYKINGVVDTSRSVKTNIDSILQSGGAWLSYDVSTGNWRPIIKRAVTAEFTASRTGSTLSVTAFSEGRIAAGMTIYDNTGTSIGVIVSQTLPLSAGESTGQIGTYTMSLSGSVGSQAMTGVNLTDISLSFSDDNITSGITISSTNLDDLYNAFEAEFFDKNNRDQRAYARASLDAGDRNPNEPDNTLRLGLEFVNNSVQAELLGNIELRQSRDDLVIEFTASHYGIQAQAGDVISVVNAIYGWSPKYFRVARVKEIETDEGLLVAQIQALEYNGDVYTVEALTEFTTEANIGIIPFRTTGTDTSRIRTPDDDRVNVIDTDTTGPIPSIRLAVKIPTTGGPYDEIQVWYAVGATAPANNAYTLYQIHKPPPPEVVFELGRTINISQIASGTTHTSTAHGLSTGDQLYYYTDPATSGFVGNSAYWVLNETANTFELATTQTGTAKTDFTNGSGLTIPLDTCHVIVITGLPAIASGLQYYFKVRVCSRGVCSEFTDPDPVTPLPAPPVTPYEPDPGASATEILNIKQAILQLDFGTIVIPNSGYWLWRTMTPVDFGTGMVDNYILDLGLTSVTENTVTATTDVETFVWQVDP